MTTVSGVSAPLAAGFGATTNGRHRGTAGDICPSRRGNGRGSGRFVLGRSPDSFARLDIAIADAGTGLDPML